jgi:hypothetical protein
MDGFVWFLVQLIQFDVLQEHVAEPHDHLEEELDE